jgi:hypothetical protein
MLSIEQELEISGNGYSPGEVTPETPTITDDIITVQTQCGEWNFSAKTGIYIGQEGMDNPLRLRPKSATRPITNYFLFAGCPDWGKDQWVKLPNEKFNTGKDAAERMKYHNGLFTSSLSPFRAMVKPETELSQVRDYPGWAEFRFKTGEWTRLPWADEPWFKKHEPAHHFAHLSVSDSCMVAFWSDEINAQGDCVCTMAPGRYLNKYFSDHLTQNEIRNWAVKVDVDCELKFVSEPEEIYAVYTADGAPNSCMTSDDDSGEWAGDMNPVRVYGAGDIHLAYLERKGKIVARALTWPEKKIFGRCYGDIERLVDKLTAEGFTADVDEHSAGGYGRGGFNGARLLRFGRGSGFIMPYVDSGYRAKLHPTDSRYLLLDKSGDICTTYTNGLSYDPDEDYDYYCAECGEGLDEFTVYVVEDNYYCEHHADVLSSRCYHCENRFHSHNLSLVDDEHYCDTCYEAHTVTCDYCSERTSSATTIYTASGNTAGEACQSCLDDAETFQVDDSGRHILIEQEVEQAA